MADHGRITAWLEVRVLPSPPLTLGLTEISRFSPNSPRMGGVCLARFCLCNGVLEPASTFELFVSAFKNPFPGNGDCGSKRPGSTKRNLVRQHHAMLIADRYSRHAD